MDDMNEIVLCKYCGKPEYYGKMMWLSDKCCCRSCYKEEYRVQNNNVYSWNDLDGEVPTMLDYAKQQENNQGSSANQSFHIYSTERNIYKIYDCKGMFDYSGIKDNHTKTVYIFNTVICVGSYNNLQEALDGITKYEENNYENK